jgi:hypothetical protein
MCCAAGGCSDTVPRASRPAARIEWWDDAEWRYVLERVTTDDGFVRYERLKRNDDGVRDALYRYVGALSAASPDNRPALFATDADRLAYWINAYNAVCLYRIVQRHYPGNVLASVPPGAIFFVDRTRVGGRAMTLDAIEKRKVRSAGDPRVHFALNCASYSCPPLRREPYAGDRLDAQLAEQGRVYLSDARAVKRVDADTLALNDIFTDFYKDEITRAHETRTGRRRGCGRRRRSRRAGR